MLGQGQHASVFKCFKLEDKEQLIPYAVKQVRTEDQEIKNAHIKEYEILKGLKHTNIIKVVEIFNEDWQSRVNIVMEFVDGKELLE